MFAGVLVFNVQVPGTYCSGVAHYRGDTKMVFSDESVPSTESVA